ncbi:hypothetical protein WJX84_003216 [Apatococcus fuscideae]|uniref:Guanylate cyclase domain-containing protein n=1 Tax=Apatococcus fuscideae TaxID=2026836 RepID=A0AAW1RDV9_9CHLO
MVYHDPNLTKENTVAGNGKALTIVTSDIEGSTELWEKDPEATNMALQLHDDIFRRYLSAYYGFELATEGDAFVLAFHSAPDAVMYCLTVQKVRLLLVFNTLHWIGACADLKGLQ